MKLAKIIDNTRCIGCHACSTACKSENDVPIGVDRTRVKYVEAGTFPNVRRHFQVTRCNQCEHPPCVYICPVTAMYQRPDGIVEFNQETCIGCRACMAACPYDAIHIDPETHSAAKCHFCAHRMEIGLQPACVVVCPEEAIIVGDLDDPESVVSKRIAREAVQVRKPELGTSPKLYYIGASSATLRPEAAARPEGDIFMWASQRADDETVGRGPGNTAATLLAYDTGHTVPWGTDVVLYLWTKSIAAGALLVVAVATLSGRLTTSTLSFMAAPVIAMLFMAITMFLLVVDLEHPKKFYTILTRPQWRSWLVRGAYVLMAYGAIAGLWILPGILGYQVIPNSFLWYLSWFAIPSAAFAACYTAFLFAQATGRELWATPLAAPHLVVQSGLAGSAVLLLVAAVVPELVTTTAGAKDHAFLKVFFLAALGLHALLVLGEIFAPHRTTHVSRAVDTIVNGKFSRHFWFGTLMLGVAAPVVVALAFSTPLGWAGAAILALAGLYAWEYCWVYGGQSVPLS